MFAAPSHPPAVSDARKTFANTAGRAPKEALGLKHGRTGELASTVAFAKAASSAADKKTQLVLVLEENLARQFGVPATGPAREAVHHAVQAAVLGGTARVTPESMRDLQAKVAALLAGGDAPAPKPVVARASAVLSATAARATAGATLSSSGRAVVGSRPAAAAAGGAKAAPAAAPKGAAVPAASPIRLDDTTGGFDSRPPAMDSPPAAGGAGGGPSSPQLRQLRERLMADPEPEKVLGLIDEVGAALEKKKARERAVATFAHLRADLSAAEAEKRERKEREKTLESMWKGVVEATASDMAAREAREAAEAHAREQEQKRIREAQIAEEKVRRAHDKAEKHAYETYQLKLTMAEEELRRQEAAAALEEKRAVVRAQMEDNMRALDRKKASEATRRLEEQRAMEELNAMVEAQARARSEAVKAVFDRQDRLLAIAADKKREATEREEVEKTRTLAEFEAARAAIAAAERADAEARRTAASAFRGDLDGQVEEKRHRSDKDKAAARATQLLLQERAKAAEREQHAAKLALADRRADYRTVLEKQVAAAAQLHAMKKERERAAIAESLEAHEGDEELMAVVSAKLAERAAAAERAREIARAQADAFRLALIEAGIDPAEAAARANATLPR